MFRNTGTILGISLGTRFMGVAVVRQKTLISWETKTFRGTWTSEKNEKIIATVKGILNQYKVSQVAIKIPHPSRSSSGLNMLVEDITALCKRYKCRTTEYSLSDIESIVPLSKKWNKRHLQEHLVEVYPELFPLKGAYHEKLFEAVSVAHICTVSFSKKHPI